MPYNLAIKQILALHTLAVPGTVLGPGLQYLDRQNLLLWSLQSRMGKDFKQMYTMAFLKTTVNFKTFCNILPQKEKIRKEKLKQRDFKSL